MRHENYQEIEKNFNKVVKGNSTVEFIYKGFILHRKRDAGWGYTYYDIHNAFNPMFAQSQIKGPKLHGDDMKDAKRAVDELIELASGGRSDYSLINDFDYDLVERVWG